MQNMKFIPEIQHVFTTTDQIHFGIHPNGNVQINFGAVSVNLSFDATHDFLFRLASFISAVEKYQDKISIVPMVDTLGSDSIQ
jgi:hypothetical protein